MLGYARSVNNDIEYLSGSATDLPFEDASFDHSIAITSLCFVDTPAKAVSEMWRISRKSVTLGLLNRNSLLYRKKHGNGAYRGARWDQWNEVKDWFTELRPHIDQLQHATAVFFPNGNLFARIAEFIIPSAIPFGGFLSIHLRKEY